MNQMVPAPWGTWDGLRYGLLGLPLAFCALPLYVLMPNLYARQWGVPLAALGAVLLGVRLLDAVLDPVLGRLCDRLFAHSLRAVLGFGAAAAVMVGVGFSLVFMPPLRQPAALLWWVAAVLLPTYAAYSLLTVMHQSWGAMLGGNALYRSRVVAWSEGLGLLGVLMACITPILWGIPALLIVLAVSLCGGWWVWSHAPRPQIQRAGAGSSQEAIKVWRPLHNPAFRRLLMVYLLNGIASAIPATLVLFFVQDRLQASEAMQSAALGIYFLCGAASMPWWLRIVKRWGLERSWLLGMVFSIVAFAGTSLLGAGDAMLFLLVCALSGSALGSDLTMPGALLSGLIADAGDRGRAEGTYFGWWHFTTKLNLALAAGLALPLLGWLGYAPGARDAPALQVLTLAYGLLPCALKALAAAALYLFPIQPMTLRNIP